MNRREFMTLVGASILAGSGATGALAAFPPPLSRGLAGAWESRMNELCGCWVRNRLLLCGPQLDLLLTCTP